MRLAAQIISIFGALLGMFNGLGVLLLGESALVGPADRGSARLLGLLAIVVALTGVAGGVAIAERPELARPFLLISGGAGFALLGWGWLLTGLLLATGALLALLDDPDRRPYPTPVTTTGHTQASPVRRWLSARLLRPQEQLGFGGGLLYVLVVMLLVYGAVLLLSNVAALAG